MTTHLVLFRDDLRVYDHEALHAAVAAARQTGGRVYAAYVLDEESEEVRPLGRAVKWWLHHSLTSHSQALKELGINLVILRGKTLDTVPALASHIGATHLHYSRRYALPERTVDTALKDWAHAHTIEAHSYTGFLLHEPWVVKPASGDFYKVFTPFWKALSAQDFPAPLPAPQSLGEEHLAASVLPESVASNLPGLTTIDGLTLLPTRPDWAVRLKERWTPGETSALKTCRTFVESTVHRYDEGRDRPSQKATSNLSPHLRFGEISPRYVLHALHTAQEPTANTASFASEIGWREFCWHLTFHNPNLHNTEFRSEWQSFPWLTGNQAPQELTAWQKGLTGVPLVDAGMRELWETGHMHNRVRMVVASYLTKNLLINWREGERWFWDTLVDADTASNPCNWQWVAGCGADAAPYFRIFNPLLQGKKFDASALYIKRWVPELVGADARTLHTEHPEGFGFSAPDYPVPLVDLKASRQEALDIYKTSRRDVLSKS
ncbi:deoxyribodipyrimidine photo-lyase [Rothia sp. ZJ932]|uniref:cryptochrome/photolyase family protein n=1 Tax=Rothia sp. ZJ932 TaxID=2810516 RepID=UPI001968644B|nr:deoxyribodipyrimidine photo-lyase [Rothia sp. ZJ932]QRZ61521.1 deoxyribodipyrimidine photo-lyase [Rothia sp. ZJ932]